MCAALARKDITVACVDISQSALRLARRNIDRYELSARVTLAHGDLFEPLSGERFDAIVSNPPYIAPPDVPSLMPEVRDYEPAIALYENAGRDGLSYYRRLFAQAAAFLTQGGWMAVEAGAGQADEIVRIARQAGYNDIEIRLDGAGIERVVIGRLPGKAV